MPGRTGRVHVFACTGRFGSFDEMRDFIDMSYTEDGDGVRSPFIREVELRHYEPGCIEAIHRPAPTPLKQLLERASYADQWLIQLDTWDSADAAIWARVDERDDRPVAQGRERADLLVEPLARVDVGRPRQPLEGHLLTRALIHGPVDRAEAAPPEPLVHDVRTHPLHGAQPLRSR